MAKTDTQRGSKQARRGLPSCERKAVRSQSKGRGDRNGGKAERERGIK